MDINAEHMEINDDLLITYLLDEATAEQVKHINEWLAKDAANQKSLQQFRLIWETSKALNFDYEPDAQASLMVLKQKAIQQQAARMSSKSYVWLKIAATVLMICGGAWLFSDQFAKRQVEMDSMEVVKTDTLSDGSVITLNKHSLLQYPKKFTGNQRHVRLNYGEAFFKVTPDKARPFIINCNKTTIKVVGTSFNVKNKKNSVEVIVETGIVQVSKNDHVVTLRPGEKVLVKADARLVKVPNPDQLYTYYRTKEFVANNTPLWRMVEVLNEAYDSHISIGPKELHDLPLNTTFKNESLDDVLQVISHTFKITVEKRGNKIILK